MPGQVKKQVHFAPTSTVYSPPPNEYTRRHGRHLSLPSLSSASSSTSNGSLLITPPQYAHGLPGPMYYNPSPVAATFNSPTRQKSKSAHPLPPPATVIQGIHPFLVYSTSPVITYDLREPPSTLSSTHRGLPCSVLSQPATSPPTSRLTIVSPQLPWRITIKHSSSAVTAQDVFSELYRALRTPITSQEYQALLPSDRERRRVAAAYEDRYKHMHVRGEKEYEDEKRGGVRRVDFLMGKTRFRGLEVAIKPRSSVGAGDEWVLLTS